MGTAEDFFIEGPAYVFSLVGACDAARGKVLAEPIQAFMQFDHLSWLPFGMVNL